MLQVACGSSHVSGLQRQGVRQCCLDVLIWLITILSVVVMLMWSGVKYVWQMLCVSCQHVCGLSLQQPSLMRIRCRCNGHVSIALVDSGATHSFVSRRFVKKHGLKFAESTGLNCVTCCPKIALCRR
eukprot:jgi/Chrzof1/12847/Cz07g09150.t1